MRYLMKKLALLLIPLALSSFTHLWNPIGFPDIFFDEGVYMRRAMHLVLEGNPQEAFLYDHPFFGQILLASVFKVISFPDFLNVSSDASSISLLYGIPRIFMGLLAVLDTFLIYKIAENKFDKRIAFIAAVLFAVMPITWILRRILLDSLLLPFLLSSILFALYSAKHNQKTILVLLSGICLGLAIFTKVPAFTMLPIVGYLIYSGTKSRKNLVLWIIPIIMISSIWPIYSITHGEFDLWQKDVMWQAQRANSVFGIFGFFFAIDPLLLILGFSGIAYCIIRKNSFILLWFVPYMIFLSTIGFKQYFHWIMLLPALCIAAAILVIEVPKKLSKIKQKQIVVIVIACISVFGFVNTTILISNDLSKNQFEAASYVVRTMEEDTTIMSSPVYSWIFDNIFEIKHVPLDYSMILYAPIETNNVLLMVDNHFFIDIDRGKEIREVYENTKSEKRFEGLVTSFDLGKYPYGIMEFDYGQNKTLSLDGTMKLNYDSSMIDIRKGHAAGSGKLTLPLSTP